MSRYKIGCQSITFGTPLHQQDIAQVFGAVSEAGYDGIEIGFFRLDPARTQEYKAMLESYALKLAAVHVGGNIFDLESQKDQVRNIATVLDMAKTLGARDVFFSGSRTSDSMTKQDFAEQAVKIAELGKRAADAGLTLCYHNHDWEIRNDLLGLRTILEQTDPDQVKLVLDVGWVTKGGADPVEVIKTYGSRVKHLHFKEFTADGSFTELGQGIVNFPGVVDAAKGMENCWIIAEQDESRIGAAESVRLNCAYMRNLIKEA
ncbi:MAG TPA: sugar phosphate isomerase/epimerase [Clostridia bacterium]|nr:sugar phosphate isomerase/epimerase [Clostridia bacterium]